MIDPTEGNLQQGYAVEASAKEAMLVGSNSSRTVGQNIQYRIQQHKEAIAKLEAVMDGLRGGSILDVNLSDLQQAMRW